MATDPLGPWARNAWMDGLSSTLASINKSPPQVETKAWATSPSGPTRLSKLPIPGIAARSVTPDSSRGFFRKRTRTREEEGGCGGCWGIISFPPKPEGGDRDDTPHTHHFSSPSLSALLGQPPGHEAACPHRGRKWLVSDCDLEAFLGSNGFVLVARR